MHAPGDTITALAANPLEHQGQRVVTLRQVDEVHQRPLGTAKHAFRRRRTKFSEGEDYFRVSRETFPGAFSTPGEMIVLTESGYALLAKVFDDDRAWEAQKQLVRGYFRARDVVERLPDDAVIVSRAALEAMQHQMDEQSRNICRFAIEFNRMVSDGARNMRAMQTLMRKVDVKKLASENPDQALIPGVNFAGLFDGHDPDDTSEVALVAKVVQFLRGRRAG